MKTVTMVELRQESATILGRLSKGERLVLSHRGKPVARLEPIAPTGDSSTDPFMDVYSRAMPSPKSPTSHQSIDSILYGKS